MAHQQDHNLTPTELAARAWELAKGIQFALFTTWDGQKQAH